MESEPLYLSIANTLAQRIKSGYYNKGEKLPTEAKLCKKFNVSRVTIRQALNLLVVGNLVKKVQGCGTIVIYSQNASIIERSSKIHSFSDSMREIGHTPSSKVIKFTLMQANRELANDLMLEENEPVIYYERILSGDNYPYCLENAFLPAKYFSKLTLEDLTHSKFEYIEKEKGYCIDYSHQVVHAILADKRLQDILQVDINSPLLSVTHITYLDTGHPIEKNTVIFDSSVYPAHFIKKRH